MSEKYALRTTYPSTARASRYRMNREQRRRTHLGSNAAYRRTAVAGQILFTGAFLWVAAAFAAMVYAWRKV